MPGFFKLSELSKMKVGQRLVPECGKCKLYLNCHTPKMPVSGSGQRKILVLAESPGEQEDEQGVQLVGNSGQKLEEVLRKHKVRMRRDCWLTNSLICHPKDNEITNAKMIDWCRPNLIKTLKELKPEIIIPIGSVAITSLMKYVWKENDVGTISQWAGWRIPCQKLNAWICPTYHPSFVLREKNEALEVLFSRHLRRAVELEGRPWKEIPKYEEQVERVYDTDKAAEIIYKMIERGGTVAFDYETNMKKPDSQKAQIFCCSISWEGKKTIAYPWHGKAIRATRDMLRSPLRKIASNMKYEERWSRRLLQTKVRNWDLDTMLAAHHLDNREGVTSIKFQAFAVLGLSSWDEHIRPYLHNTKNGQEENRIREISMDDLLLYCGMDSLIEFVVAKAQKQRMGLGAVSPVRR